MPPRIVRAVRRSDRLRGANARTRQQALGPLFSRVVNDEDLAVLSSILEQMDDLNDVARLRQTCRVLRDGVDACMKMKRTVVGERKVSLDMDRDIPWQLMAWKRDWTRNPWATWVARGDMRRERPHMTRALSRCNLAAVRVGKEGHENLLHVASYCGHAGMVMLLLGKGVKKDMLEPLYIACRKGHLEVVRLLIEARANKDKAGMFGRTPLFIASHYGHLEIVRLLVKAGADKDKAENTGATPLWIASQNGHLEVVRLLVESGARKNKRTDKYRRTLLFFACEKHHLAIAQLLITKGADKDKADKHGQTPLLVACGKGHLEVVRLLVVAGADKNKASRMGSTPLQIARVLRHDGIVEMLQRAGATG